MLLNSIVNILCPHYCFSCRKLGRPLCSTCSIRLTQVEKTIVKTHRGITVSSCYSYSGVFKNTLRGAKYFGSKEALHQLCDRVPWDRILKEDNKWRLVPVPLHPKRQKERGFNQALVIAQHISRATSLPINECIKRDRHTLKQARLLGSERANNLKGAFSVQGTVPYNIVIVDDVCTTGSTIWEVAHTCLESGARNVIAITLAQ